MDEKNHEWAKTPYLDRRDVHEEVSGLDSPTVFCALSFMLSGEKVANNKEYVEAFVADLND